MTQSDRAFHALAQNEPEVVFAALRAICPEVVAGAATLLADPRTVCFAPGGDAGQMGDEALCDAVAGALVAADASWYQRLMAVTTAHTRGRDEAMTRALSKAGSPPIIIEDIFFMGEDKGILKTSVRSVLAVAEARGFKLTKAQRERVEKCKDLPKLDRWLKQAATAAKATEIFAAPPAAPRRRKAEAM